MEFYENIDYIVNAEDNVESSTKVVSYDNPEGWQAVLRCDENAQLVLVVVHRLENEEELISIPLPDYKKWSIQQEYSTKGNQYHISDSNVLEIHGLHKDNVAGVWLY